MLDIATELPIGGQSTIPYLATKPDPADSTNKSKSTPFNLTGYTLRFTLKARPEPGPPYVIQKDSGGLGGVTISDATNGIASISFLSTDTLNLAAGVYFFDIVAVNGAVQVPLDRGSMTFNDRVSR